MTDATNENKKGAAADDAAPETDPKATPEAAPETAPEAATESVREDEAGTTEAADADAVESADDPEPAEADRRIAALEAEVADLRDQLLRALAETENVRRRAQRERDDALKYGPSKLAGDLVVVADNLRRAVESVPAETAEQDGAVKSLLSGVEMTERELAKVFDKHGIRKVDPKGERFDAHLHQAMFEVPDGSLEPGTVAQVMQVGYVMHDRLLRPAMVGVAKQPPQPAAEDGDETPKKAAGGKKNG